MGQNNNNIVAAMPRRPTQLGSMVHQTSPDEEIMEVWRGTPIRQSTNKQLYLSESFLPVRSRRIILYDPPRQRQRWDDDEVLPHVNWADLYFDLFYVAAAYNLSYVLMGMDLTTPYECFLYFLGLFGPILIEWFITTYFDARFSTGADPYNWFVEMLRLCFLATAVVHIRPPYEMREPSVYPDMFGFALGCTCLCIVNVYTSLEVITKGVGDKQAIKHSETFNIMSYSIQFVFYLAATCISGIAYYGNTEEHARLLAGAGVTNDDNVTHIPIILCIAGWVSNVILFMLNMLRWKNKTEEEFKNRVVPLNVGFCIHRIGELVMLLLGESILSLLIVETSTNQEYYIALYAGIISSTLLMYLFFKYQPHSAEEHALNRSWGSIACYHVFIIIFCFSLIGLGTSYKMFLKEYEYYNKFKSKTSRLRNLVDVVRNLAGLELGGLSPFTDEWRQKAANLYSTSLSVGWASLEFSICHEGPKEWYAFGKSKAGIIIEVIRLCLIIFIATLSKWVIDGDKLSVIGMCVLVLEVIVCFVWDYCFTLQYDDQEHNDQLNDDLEEEEEVKTGNQEEIGEDQFHENE